MAVLSISINKTIQAARLKGAQTIVTGMSPAVAEAVVDLGVDWRGIQTLATIAFVLFMIYHAGGGECSDDPQDVIIHLKGGKTNKQTRI